MKNLITFEEFLNESFRSNYNKWVEILNKNGYHWNENSANYDYWFKTFDTGVSFIEIYDSTDDKGRDVESSQYFNFYFIPYVKVDKKLFGLIKTRLTPKTANITSGVFDFGEGLFAVDEKPVMDNFDRLLKTVDKRISKLNLEWREEDRNKQNIFKAEFWKSKGGRSLPSEMLYKDPKDYTDKGI